MVMVAVVEPRRSKGAQMMIIMVIEVLGGDLEVEKTGTLDDLSGG